MTKEQTQDDLKPCPFCGGKAINHGQVDFGGVIQTRIGCQDCGARSPLWGDGNSHDAWNRRALTGSSDARELVEAFIAQKKKCCRYCADDRPAFERDGAWWHEVARGGDACDTEPCKAHLYHAALAKYRSAPLDSKE